MCVYVVSIAYRTDAQQIHMRIKTELVLSMVSNASLPLVSFTYTSDMCACIHKLFRYYFVWLHFAIEFLFTGMKKPHQRKKTELWREKNNPKRWVKKGLNLFCATKYVLNKQANICTFKWKAWQLSRLCVVAMYLCIHLFRICRI